MSSSWARSSSQKQHICEKCEEKNESRIPSDSHSVDIKPDTESPQIIANAEPELPNDSCHHPKPYENADCVVCGSRIVVDALIFFCQYCGKRLPDVCNNIKCKLDNNCKSCKACPTKTEKLVVAMNFHAFISVLGIIVLSVIFIVTFNPIDPFIFIRRQTPQSHSLIQGVFDQYHPNLPRFFLNTDSPSSRDEYEILGWCDQKKSRLCIKTMKNDEIYNIYVALSDTETVKKYVSSGLIRKGDGLKERIWFLLDNDLIDTRSDQFFHFKEIHHQQYCAHQIRE